MTGVYEVGVLYMYVFVYVYEYICNKYSIRMFGFYAHQLWDAESTTSHSLAYIEATLQKELEDSEGSKKRGGTG